MRYRPIALFSLILAGSATAVLAQNVQALQGLNQAMSLVGGIFQGAFGGIAASPNVWIRVIFGIILMILLEVGLRKPVENKNSRIVLSIAIAIGAVAAIPSDLVNSIFNALGAIWVILLFLPLLFVLKYTIGGEHSRMRSWTNAIYWALLAGFYSSVSGNNLSASYSSSAGILSLTSIIGTIIWVIKAFKGPTTAQFEGDMERTFRQEEVDLSATAESANDVEQATREVQTNTTAQQAALADSQRNFAELQKQIAQIQQDRAQDDANVKVLTASYDVKLKAAQDSQKSAESEAEKLRKAQEAAAAKQQLDSQQAENGRKADGEKQQFQLLINNAANQLDALATFAKSSVGKLIGAINRIKNLETKVKDALEQITRLQSEVSGLANLETKNYTARVTALNDAQLTTQFAALQTRMKDYKSQVAGLLSLKIKLEQHLQYYVQSREQLERLAKRIQTRGKSLDRYVAVAKNSSGPNNKETLSNLLDRIQTMLLEQTAWFDGAKKDLEALQQYANYQGKAASIIREDVTRSFREVDRLYKVALPVLNQSVNIFETELRTAETQKAQTAAALGRANP